MKQALIVLAMATLYLNPMVHAQTPPGAGGLQFDGINDYVTFGAAPGLGLTNFTLEAWLNWNGQGVAVTSGGSGITAIPVITKGRGEYDGDNRDLNYFFGIRSAGNVLAADFEEWGTTAPPAGYNHPVWGNTPVTPNVWHHVAATYNGAAWQLFLDGVLETNLPAGQLPRWDSIQHAALGSALTSVGTPAGYFAGVMDEVRIWNYARSAAQVASNRTARIPAAPGLVGRWSLDETNGSVALDSSGNGINGTLLGGPVWTNGYQFSTPPSVVLTSPANNAVLFTPVNLALSADAGDSDGVVAKVEFFQGATKLGETTNAPFTLTWNGVAPGRYTLRAVATDNDGLTTTSAPVNITVESSIVRLTSPTNGAVFYLPDNLAITADASDTNGAITRVEFFAGTSKLGEAAGRPFSLVWSNAAAGSYVLSAVATDAGGIRSTSAPVSLTLLVNEPPAVAITSPADNATVYAPTNLELLASASDSDGSVARVDFFGDGAGLGQASASPYRLVWTNPPVGPHTLSAVATDNRGLSATSAMVRISVEVNTAPTIQSVSPAPGPVTTLTSIQVTFSEPVTGVNAGDLLVNGVPATQVSGSGAAYTFTFTQPAPGSVAITWAANHGITDQGIPPMAFDQTGPGATWNYGLPDNTPPTLAAKNPPANATVAYLTQVQVTFSEPVQGVDAGDLLVNGSPAIALSGSGASYTFSFLQPDFGTVTFAWAEGHGITDLSSNPFNGNGPGATWHYTVQPPRQILVATNAQWRLFKGVAEASSPLDAWRAPAFNDAGWGLSRAPFYYDLKSPATMYGNTMLSDMFGAYQCIYLRCTFTAANPYVMSNLVLVSKSDDGFIAWINGTELFRSSTVSAGDLTFDYAPGTVRSANEPLPFVTNAIAIPATVLVPGTNVLTVQAMNSGYTGNDFMIDAELSVIVVDPALWPPTLAAVTPPAGEVFSLNSLTLKFSEPITNVDASDLLINGLPAAGCSGASNLWTFTFPQPADGVVDVTWAANHGIVDFDSPPKPFNGTAPGATFRYSLLNPNAPSIVGQTPAAGATINHLTQLQVTFSKSVTGVDAADLLVNRVPATGVSGSGAIRTFTFPQPAYGNVTISWAAGHGITDLADPPNAFETLRAGSTWPYTLVDQTPPAIAAQDPPAGSFVTNLTHLQVTFSESVGGVNAGDLLINGLPATSISGSGAVYTFAFPQPNASVINVGWAADHGISDLAIVPNAFDAGASGATWSYTTADNVPPVVARVSPMPFLTMRSLTQITVTFDEPVSGVEAGDLLINSLPATEVSGAGAGPYTFVFNPTATGQVQVAWAPGHGIGDLAATPNPFGGGSWTYVVNPSLPTEFAVSYVVHISLDGAGATYIENYVRNAPTLFASFARLQAEGAWTLNARCDYTISVTLPNHACQFTSRPVDQPAGWANTTHHGLTIDGDNGQTIHTAGNPNVPYKMSAFDVVHDHGLSTAFLYSKQSLTIFTRSWDAAHGASDVVGADNGPNKIDTTFNSTSGGGSYGPTAPVVDQFVQRAQTNGLWNYTFMHFDDGDATGHASGWGSAAYSNAIMTADQQIGRVLNAIHSNPTYANCTVVIVTADHGGSGSGHFDPANLPTYRVPLYVWGAGIPAGMDLYSLFSNRADPGTSRPSYSDTNVLQPLRNGDVGNLAVTLLGLPPIPGSSMLPAFSAPPVSLTLTITRSESGLVVSWPADAAGYELQATGALGPAADWQTITSGITTLGANRVYMVVPGPESPLRFFRLQKQ